MSISKIAEENQKEIVESFIKELRTNMLGFPVNQKGRSIVDQQGAMFLAEDVDIIEREPKAYAMQIKTKWGI